MGRIEESVEVAAPLDEVYGHWVRCEDFPQFMRGDGSENVTTEVVEGERVAWEGATGPVRHSGVVTFHQVDAGTTRLMLQLEIEPHGLWEHLAEALGFVDRRVIDDLYDFKHHVEERATPMAG
ncbi:SRPBCC family protein [Kitasatospora sp. NPDC048365]|uniref:SRPBCC family protein n=1 Tax=Kitasatospora sp. NPDC048365 TaxID=3364050 RepID=UPI00371EF403